MKSPAAGSHDTPDAAARDDAIFIDFAAADRDRIRPLVAVIQAHGYRVWMDEDLGSGASWEREIERAITSAACVLVVLTEHSGDKPALLVDAARAGMAHKLLPVRLDPVPLPAQLANVQALDLTAWTGQAEHPELSRLLATIERIADPPTAAPKLQTPRTETTAPPTRRIRIPDIAWVEVPGGAFIWQAGERLELPTFWIAKYPVTNAQYQCFIDDSGYDEDRWWRDLERPEPENPRWSQGNRPRTNVNWYEAVAFCRWFTARLGVPADSIRLPTELEWEKAARGEQGLEYPWGGEYRSGLANVDETDRYDIAKSKSKAGTWFLDQTTAVGVYPHGRSPYGVEDLAGTVWEWCLNKRDDLDAIEADISGAARALRGGSWFNPPQGARADLRFRSHPVLRVDGGGFRLLSSVPIDAVR